MVNSKETWIIASIMLSMLKTVSVQFAMPMPMYQPPPPPMVMMAPPPPPVQIPVGVPYPVPVPIIVTKKTTTTTTTTTESPENGDGDGKFAIAVPLPFGVPMPFVVPQAPPPAFCTNKTRPKQCPPCPPCVCSPSCTPAFYSFCSPCHQKCRCKGNSAPAPEPPKPPPPVPLPMLPPPMPMPAYPMAPAPPPVFIFPLPPAFPYRRPPRRIPSDQSSTNECSSSSSGSGSSFSSDSDSDRRRRRRRRYRIRRPFRNLRKNARSGETEKGTIVERGELVKPMLSYISEKGDVKFEKQISQDDAAKLMKDTDKSNSLEIQRRSAYVVKDKRKVIFSPPPHKSITNLTVSFNVV